MTGLQPRANMNLTAPIECVANTASETGLPTEAIVPRLNPTASTAVAITVIHMPDRVPNRDSGPNTGGKLPPGREFGAAYRRSDHRVGELRAHGSQMIWLASCRPTTLRNCRQELQVAASRVRCCAGQRTFSSTIGRCVSSRNPIDDPPFPRRVFLIIDRNRGCDIGGNPQLRAGIPKLRTDPWDLSHERCSRPSRMWRRASVWREAQLGGERSRNGVGAW